jgi:hypothetical protein
MMTASSSRSSERGIAMVLALFMVSILSVLGTSLMFVSQTETWSSYNYRLTSQARYGAESGIHVAANHLLYSYTAPTTGGADAIASYDLTVSPVEFGGDPVVLSSSPDVEPNYPVDAVQDAFEDATTGTLAVTNGSVTYTASATLLSMRQFNDVYAGAARTVQTWLITAVGEVPGPRPAKVEASAIIERQVSPVFTYAAFATYSGCAALSFAGGATTDSYDSSAPLVGGVPVVTADGGNVGTNGNLTEVGDPTTIHGSLSTPRSGVGACTSNNVTAQTVSGNASIDEGLIELPQPVEYPTPPAPDPLPPTTSQGFTQNGGCPAGAPAECAASAGGATITPASASSTVTLGNMSLAGSTTVHLNAGTYVINSIDIAGSAQIVIDSGPVIFQVAGQGVATPIKIEGDGISNPTFNPSNLQFIYGGTGNIQVAGGTETSALLYAPNATGGFAGGSHWYGAVILKQVTATGGATIHYDRRLQTSGVTAGNHMMSAFTWKSF